MTIEQFLEEVSKYEWQADGPFIRSKEEVSFFESTHILCPLCYVAYKLTGNKIRNSRFEYAADLLGIDPANAGDIAAAADNHRSTDLDVWLRDQLKKAAHLE